MREPVWLPIEAILALHEQLLARFGGSAGVRDKGMLESALGRPQQLSHYGDPSVFAIAASYAFGIVKNHPFIDGNKRTGFMAAYTFLGVNGYRLVAPEEEAVVQTLGLASGAIGEEDYAAWLEGGSEQRS
ncbi:type II toxin-antitoxin system death-on-curing family toxin [Haloferula sp.]|uniref:type II toxin-antitoxin system death-on-curing family toxin n=1 Tax=Haloferula sp. TaxID=2497595 RepID=UPI003C7762C2